jgi:hypothetical protein
MLDGIVSDVCSIQAGEGYPGDTNSSSNNYVCQEKTFSPTRTDSVTIPSPMTCFIHLERHEGTNNGMENVCE